MPDESRAAGEIRRAIPSIDDDAGDFLLHGEHIRDRAVIAFRPEMTSVGGADELRSDAITAFRTVPSSTESTLSCRQMLRMSVSV